MHSEPAAFVDVRSTIVRNAVFVGLAVSVYGVSFGAMGITAGLSVVQTSALSILMFTGASQLAFVGVIGAGGAPATAIATALLLGIRNAMYAVRMSTILRVRGGWRMLAAQLTIDESTALSIAQDESIEEGRASRLGFWSGGLSVFVLWNIATLAGALSAQAMGDPKALGLDTAIAAGLAGLLWPRLRDRESRAVAVGALLLALMLTPFMPAGVPVLACSLIAFGVAGVTLRRHPEVQG
jgi:predicted branched-subunit amino acid permease